MESIKNIAENTEVEKLLNKYNWKIISILSEGSLYQLKNENYFPDYYYIELNLTQNTLASFKESLLAILKISMQQKNFTKKFLAILMHVTILIRCTNWLIFGSLLVRSTKRLQRN